MSLIDWDSGARRKGHPRETEIPGLPDFLVLISPEDPKASHYRIRLQTSDRG